MFPLASPVPFRACDWGRATAEARRSRGAERRRAMLSRKNVAEGAVDIYRELREIFCDVFDRDEIELTPSTTADDIEGWDSLAHLRIMMSVERAFQVRFSAAEVAALRNVGDLAEMIAARLSDTAATA